MSDDTREPWEIKIEQLKARQREVWQIVRDRVSNAFTVGIGPSQFGGPGSLGTVHVAMTFSCMFEANVDLVDEGVRLMADDASERLAAGVRTWVKNEDTRAGEIMHTVGGAELGEHERHRIRHVTLHRMVDELASDYARHHPDALLSETTVMQLLQWSHTQTLDPTEHVGAVGGLPNSEPKPDEPKP